MKSYLSLGSNMGDRKKNLLQAIDLLKTHGTVNKLSSFYESEPVGKTDQSYFLNCCIEYDFSGPARELLNVIHLIENTLGRVRSEKWGPRIIDIDIIFFGNDCVNEAQLVIPHALFSVRKFVLIPLVEIAPKYIDPRSGHSVEEILSHCSDESIVVKL